MRTRAAKIALHISSKAPAPRTPRDRAGLTTTSWICQSCRSKGTIWRAQKTSSAELWPVRASGTRQFSISAAYHEEAQLSKDGDRHELPSKQESRRSHASRRLSHMMDNMQTNIFFAGQRLNDLTGYSAIETLKNEISRQEELVQATRESLRIAKENYTQAINQRSQSQREVNELLQRKHAWSPQDLERFTSLYRSDHANEQAESSAQAAVTEAEHAVEEAATRLSASILARYHEEQIWSDKIRRMSTWGTWGLMGVNVLLFLVFQIGVEPWRRKRLVKGFEDKVVEALEKETATQKGLFIQQAAAMAEQQYAPPAVPVDLSLEENTAVSKEETLSDSVSTASPQDNTPVGIRDQEPSDIFAMSSSQMQNFLSWLSGLFGDQKITIRQVDITTKFIEGALSSAVIISLVSAVARRG